MTKIATLSYSLIFALFSITSLAETTTEIETKHLLDYIGNSHCIFIRNGTEYPSKEAASHIKRKYNHMRNKVKTTEQVIKYAATESSFSGDPYMIKCPGKEQITSAEWLTVELTRYRAEPQVD